MLALKLVRLIERHSEELAIGLTDRLRQSERTRDFCKVSPQDLCLAAVEIYHNLGEWLLQKTETDIAERFRALGARRAAEGLAYINSCGPWSLAAIICGTSFNGRLSPITSYNFPASSNCTRC
jgi:hypothetical protein